MARIIRWALGLLITSLIVGAPLAYSHYCQTHMRNFHVVHDGVLYRSGQMSLSGLQRVLHDYGIKTVVTLRDAADPKDPPPDLDEEKFCRAEGIRYHRIPPRNWWAPGGTVPAEKGVRKFREVMDDPTNYPVLVHCFAGVHRTGAYVAVYRMEYERWSNERALNEVFIGGYKNLEDEWDIREYLEGYEPRWRRKLNESARTPGPDSDQK